MTGRTLHVYLDGTLCGAVEQTASGNLTFEYDPAYRAAPGATPLSLSMPLAAGRHRKRAVLPYLQGLLPDNSEALRAMARRYSVSAANPFALLEHVGADVAGAVQILPPQQELPDATQPRTTVRPVSEAEVATMLDHVVAEYEDGTPFAGPAGRFSLAGAQPKIALHQLADGRWGVPEDATPTTHILKPVTGSFRRLDIVEQLTMRAAELLGNEVARCDIARIGPWDVFVTTRYDRALVDGRWRRLHQEDLCQALAVPPDKKYQHRDGGPGSAAVAALIRSLPFDADRAAVGEGFFRAFVFNIVAGCTDAHAKNYSLMLDGPRVRLAPLYDLATYAPYWDGTAPIDSAMSVAGQYRLDRISAADLAAMGRQFGVGAAAGEIVEGVRAGVVEAFEEAGEELRTRGNEAERVVGEALAGLRRLPLARG